MRYVDIEERDREGLTEEKLTKLLDTMGSEGRPSLVRHGVRELRASTAQQTVGATQRYRRQDGVFTSVSLDVARTNDGPKVPNVVLNVIVLSWRLASPDGRALSGRDRLVYFRDCARRDAAKLAATGIAGVDILSFGTEPRALYRWEDWPGWWDDKIRRMDEAAAKRAAAGGLR